MYNSIQICSRSQDLDMERLKSILGEANILVDKVVGPEILGKNTFQNNFMNFFHRRSFSASSTSPCPFWIKKKKWKFSNNAFKKYKEIITWNISWNSSPLEKKIKPKYFTETVTIGVGSRLLVLELPTYSKIEWFFSGMTADPGFYNLLFAYPIYLWSYANPLLELVS